MTKLLNEQENLHMQSSIDQKDEIIRKADE